MLVMVIGRGCTAWVNKMSEANGINEREQTIDEVLAWGQTVILERSSKACQERFSLEYSDDDPSPSLALQDQES